MTQPECVITARMLRIPVLVHVQELETTAPLLVREAIARPMSAANRVLTDSTATRNALLEVVPGLASRSAVLPTGVAAPSGVAPPRDELVDGVRICCIARVEPGAGLRTVVEALQLLVADGLPGRLEIAALTTDAATLSRLAARIEQLGIRDLVTVRSVEDGLTESLRHADLAIVPSRAETSFGGTAIEALLASRPVVVTTSKGMADWTEGFAAAVPVDDGDPLDLARVLHRVVANWTAFRRSAMTLAPFAAQRFSPDTYRAAIATEVRALTRARAHHRPLAA